jgi:hypothetical protein
LLYLMRVQTGDGCAASCRAACASASTFRNPSETTKIMQQKSSFRKTDVASDHYGPPTNRFPSGADSLVESCHVGSSALEKYHEEYPHLYALRLACWLRYRNNAAT